LHSGEYFYRVALHWTPNIFKKKGAIMSFNHFDEQGRAIMVDISAKSPTMRTAIAEAVVSMNPETLAAILEGQVTKGDVLGVARLAGIAAAKKTPDLIPLSHPLAIHHAAIDFEADRSNGTIRIMSTVRALERTGMEMEAMVSASVAALTVYDMCKGTEKGIIIGPVRLLFKEGGKSGTYGHPYPVKKEERSL
jgi:cyclic pyranopterin phosphate synthase